MTEQAAVTHPRRGRTRPAAVLPQTSARPLDRIDARLVAALGAVAISLSGVLVALAGTSSSTATFFRCTLALPVLLLLAFRDRVPVSAPVRARVASWWVRGRWHLLAGLFLGADMVLWSESIANLGAGVATVVVNVQVVVVPVVSLLLFGERIGLAFRVAAPLLLVGVAMAGGVGDPDAFGPDPIYGTVTGVLAGITYAGYLLLLRRVGGAGGRASMLVGVSVAAAAVALGSGLASGTLDLTPGWVATGWLGLLALTGQVLGWLLLGSALPRLTASTGSTLLLIQPVGAVLSGMLVLAERPSPQQLAGCLLVVVAVALVARTRRSRTEADASANAA